MKEELDLEQCVDVRVVDCDCVEEGEDPNYVGYWGRKREDYLKQYKETVYHNLAANGYLLEHLREIDRTADRMLDLLVERMAKTEGVDEEMKRTDQMGWVGAMENIYHRARELVGNDLIFS